MINTDCYSRLWGFSLYCGIKFDLFFITRYTLLVGKPPFETQSLKETYGRIKRNEYYIPSKVQHPAQLLIIKLLRPDPSTRPTVAEILEDEFFHDYIPSRLPVSCLTMLPKFASSSNISVAAARRPLLELNKDTAPSVAPSKKADPYSKRKSLGIRVVGTETTMITPSEAIAEEVNKEEEKGRFVYYNLLSVCLLAVQNNSLLCDSLDEFLTLF